MELVDPASCRVVLINGSGKAGITNISHTILYKVLYCFVSFKSVKTGTWKIKSLLGLSLMSHGPSYTKTLEGRLTSTYHSSIL